MGKKQQLNSVLIGCLCAVGCEILLGLSYVFTKQATTSASVLALFGWRFVIAFVVMNILALAGLVKIDLRGKRLKKILLVALFNPIIYFIGETKTATICAGP